jgi:hypothetical protein
MKKTIYYLLLAVTILIFAGCNKDKGYDGDVISEYQKNYEENNSDVTQDPGAEEAATAAPTVVPNHENDMISRLTGQWVSKEIGTKRPIAFQFNNFKSVSNQWGISQADIVYECIVEGGITRLLGIGENYQGDRIGSTRSARHYFVSIADEYNAIYIHYGGTKYARAKVKELGVDEIDGNSNMDTVVFYRDNSIKKPHNAFATQKGMQKGIEMKKFKTEYSEEDQAHFSFYQEDTDLTSNEKAEKVTLDFSAYTAPYFTYNSSDKLYYRYQFGGEHKDSNTGKQLAFKNIIVQYVKEWNIDKNGYQTMDLENATGKGIYITNGKMAPITWKKNEAKHFMRYYDETGAELTINPGKTYITLFPNDRTGDVKVN